MSGGIRGRLSTFIREIVFGLEDSLVSTLGAVTGIAAGTGSTFVVILSGVVLIFVEALSMSAGSYLSSKSAREVFDLRMKQDHARVLQERLSDDESLHDALKRKRFSEKQIADVLAAFSRERKLWMKEVRRCEHRFAPSVSTSPVSSGFVMGLFYLMGGVFPLLPYFFLPVGEAIVPSIVLAGVVLFVIGVAKARIVQGHWLKSGMEMTVVSLSAALLGFLVGRIAASLLELPL